VALSLPADDAKAARADPNAAAWTKAPRWRAGPGGDVVLRLLHDGSDLLVRAERGGAPGVSALPLAGWDAGKPFPAKLGPPTLEKPLLVHVLLARSGRFLDFDDVAAGSTPAGTSGHLTGGGEPGTWTVLDEPGVPGSRVLAQTSTDATSYRFPVLTWDEPVAADVRVATRFRTKSGQVDRAAGLVARAKDGDNYYITRANALEGNVRLYRVTEGRRQNIAGKDVEVTHDVWHTLALEVRGSRLVVSFDGEALIEAEDTLFPDAGKAGLWTKADSVTWFDDVEIGALAPAKP
jgi:hypothetical protein